MKKFLDFLSEQRNLKAMSPEKLRSFLKLADSASSGGLFSRTPEQMAAARAIFPKAKRSIPMGWYGKISKKPSSTPENLGDFAPKAEKPKNPKTIPQETKIPADLTPEREIRASIGRGFTVEKPNERKGFRGISDLARDVDPNALRRALEKRGIPREKYKTAISNIRSALQRPQR